MLMLLVVLLGWPLGSWAGEVTLAFNHAVAYQAGTTYQLQARQVQQGQTVLTTHLLALLAPGDCQALAPDWQTSTLCARVCLEPGEVGVEIRAVRSTATSAYSTPLLLLDLTTTAPCHPVVVRPPAPPSPPPAPTPPTNPATTAIGAGVLGAVLLTPSARPPTLLELPNLGCVSWKITGVCACGFPPQPCVTVEYWTPGWLAETVKKPGTSVLDALAPILDTALAGFSGGLPGGGGAGNASGGGHTNLQFNEVHVYGLPDILGGPCTSCAPHHAPPTLHYASELDAATWRTARALPSPLDLLLQVGTWCRLYPRGGKTITGSGPVASGCTAYRGLDIAFQPVGLPPNQAEVHVVPQPSLGTSTCMQLAWPRQTPCFTAGTPPPLWDHAAVSPRGTYAWIVWKKRSCCVNPAMTTCGLTLIGGQGANLCLLPSTPTP